MTWRLWWPYANKIIQRQSSSRHGWFKRDRSSCDEFSIINTAAAPTIPLHKSGTLRLRRRLAKGYGPAMKTFQTFRLDTVNHCLWRAEERVRLTRRAFDVLRYLVEHAERLVTQDEILEALWPETYVNPEVIKQYIRGIRKALGDDPEKPSYIENFPRWGYQFIAPVSDESAAASPSFSPKGIVGRKTALAELGSRVAQTLAEAKLLRQILAELQKLNANLAPKKSKVETR